ncbi:hypothetical protein FLA_4209 [Filimonas lacunae]|nr:hypothetical protein FLA_4209 [Filimonas lacunae]
MHLSAICLFFILCSTTAKAQQPPVVDSIYFHLYTDSLKKGVYNYINVDAKMSNGSWRPLTSKDLLLETSYGKWDENSLIIDTAFKGAYVEVKATLKSRPELTRSVKIYMKVLPDPPLKTEAELKRRW